MPLSAPSRRDVIDSIARKRQGLLALFLMVRASSALAFVLAGGLDLLQE
jgi:hypothetical protein